MLNTARMRAWMLWGSRTKVFYFNTGGVYVHITAVLELIDVA